MKVEEIRELQRQSGLTQEKFANLVGCSWSTISRWVRGISKPEGLYAKRLELIKKQQKRKKC